MKLILDKELKHKDLLLKHLRAHNVSFTGEKKYEEKIFYVLEDNELLGAMKIVLSWDMVHINALFYKNINVLESILFEVDRLYSEISSNTMIKLFEEKRMKDFEQLGFIELGRIIGTEKVLDDVTFIKSTNSLTKHYDIIYGAGIDQYNEILQNKDKAYKEKHNILDDGTNVGFAAFDGEEYLGGIIGIFKEDQMYIDLLTTTPEARGKRVGTKLMNELEKYAFENGVTNMHVGTAEFQALPFYEKLGYEVKITFENYPKGFKCYELQKML